MSVMPVADPPYEAVDASRNSEDITTVFKSQSHEQYDMNELLSCIVDDESYNEYKSEYGRSMVCGYARIGGWPCGIVANQRCMTEKKMPGGKAGPSTSANMPAVIYTRQRDSLWIAIKNEFQLFLSMTQRGLWSGETVNKRALFAVAQKW
jgi:acetyl-CoA carboxylase carboxyltransferase component